MIALCNPVAKKPYMNLRLNNDVTDTGTGGNTPTNSGVTFTTDQIGRSNMAGNWGVSTNKLIWVSSVGNTLATKINAGATILYWIKPRTLSNNTLTFILSQFYLGYDRSFNVRNINFSGTVVDGMQFTHCVDGDTNSTFNIQNLLSYNNWQFFSVVYTDNTIDLNIKVTMDSNSGSGTISKAYEASNTEVRLGARTPTNILGDFGDMSNFRFYDVTLTDGQIKILNNQKGRIRV